MKLDKDMIIVDIETTGRHGMLYSVCEIGAAKVDRDLNVYDAFHSSKYIKPLEAKFLEESMNTHGITKELLVDAPGFEEVINEFIEWTGPKGECALASWGIAFDFPFMQCQFYKLHKRWPFHYRYFDLRTVFKWEAILKGDYERRSLKDYCDLYEVKYDKDEYHTAIGDVKMTVALFKKLKEIKEQESAHQASLEVKLRDYDYHAYVKTPHSF
jgi:DNA polymerase III epsilon subunit-like protein